MRTMDITGGALIGGDRERTVEATGGSFRAVDLATEPELEPAFDRAISPAGLLAELRAIRAPLELRDRNERGICRLVKGAPTRENLSTR
jgi:hypothetical protein